MPIQHVNLKVPVLVGVNSNVFSPSFNCKYPSTSPGACTALVHPDAPLL